MTPPSSLDNRPGQTRWTSPKLPCHREGRSPVAISWYNVLHLTQYQEIAAPLGVRNDREDFEIILLLRPGSHRTWSAGS